MKKALFIVLGLLTITLCKAQIEIDTIKGELSEWAYESLQLPSNLDVSAPVKRIVVAVIDDGFRLSHKSIKEQIYTNRNEMPFNQIDDDHNGYIDDYKGWDISDGDSDVTIKKENEKEYYHGTFISSTILGTVNKCFGVTAHDKVKILPIKVLGDNATSTAIRDGYKGIEYATQMGADIICCAWNGGDVSTEELDIVNNALKKNILIIASAGNMYKKELDSPAKITGIYAIASLDTSLCKKDNSNYGMKVDLALPGVMVKAAFPVADNSFFYGEGTSAAAGLATGCAAVLKALKPEAHPSEIMEALKNTSKPLDKINFKYNGKLGAGLPQLDNAVNYLLQPSSRWEYFNPERTEGVIYFSKKIKKTSYEIKPQGAFHSIHIYPGNISKKDAKKTLKIENNNSFCEQVSLHELMAGCIVPGSYARVSTISNKKKDIPNTKLSYYVETIDSTTLYCSETIYIESEKGAITDGSGVQVYANNSSCKWLITAPNSQRINFKFLDFHTQAKIDNVWLFDGSEAHMDHAIARFSGDDIPPEVTSRTNTVLIWFVTDDNVTNEGWTLNFKGVK